MDSDGILSDEEAKFAFQIVVDILMAAHKRMQPSDEPYLRFKLVGSVEDVMRQLDLNGDGKVAFVLRNITTPLTTRWCNLT